MSIVTRQSLIKFLKIINLLILSFSLGLSSWVVYGQMGEISFSEILTARIKLQNVCIFTGYLLIWHFILRFFDFYDSRNISSRSEESFKIIQATGCCSLILGLSAKIFSIELISFFLLMFFWMVSSFFLTLNRLFIAIVLRKMTNHESNLCHIVIVGTNSRAVEFAKTIEENPEAGRRLVGFVDDSWSGIETFYKSKYPLVAEISEFLQLIRNQVVDEVVIMIPVKSFYDEISRIVFMCEEQGITVRMDSLHFNARARKEKNKLLDDEVTVVVPSVSMQGWKYFIKRMMDFSIAALLIILLSPVFLLIAVILKATSPGPAIYKQERVGRNKRRFTLYKFRTMVEGAENKLRELEPFNELGGPVFKMKNDPRITSAGRFMRKTSLDELPQLFNILKGEMSLVGPRPFSMRDYKLVNQDWHRRRCCVPPGITGLWQVYGRNSIPFERWMELDMQYIDQWSLGLDLKILFKTIPAVLTGRGAA